MDANQIKEARTRRGLSQSELADQIHVTQSKVSLWERGVCIPSAQERDILQAVLISSGKGNEVRDSTQKKTSVEIRDTTKERRNEIKEARIRAGLSQAELAKKVKASQAKISYWETGKSTPTEPEKERLRSVLGSLGTDDSIDSSPLAAWLTKARNAKGLSIHELGKRSGLSPGSIYRIESGVTRNLRESTRRQLEAGLNSQLPQDTAEEIAEESKVVGLVGKFEDFDPHVASERPASPGIYVLYDVSDRPIYVGQGENVKKRIEDHEEKFWFKRPIVESASWIRIDDSNLRKTIEELMIKFLKRNAVINKQHVEQRSASKAEPGTTEVQNGPRRWISAVDAAAMALEKGPLHIDALFEKVTSAGAKCKSKRSLDSIFRLPENRDHFEPIGDGKWRLRKP